MYEQPHQPRAKMMNGRILVLLHYCEDDVSLDAVIVHNTQHAFAAKASSIHQVIGGLQPIAKTGTS